MERWAPREGELLTKRKGKMVENNDGEQRKERRWRFLEENEEWERWTIGGLSDGEKETESGVDMGGQRAAVSLVRG